MAHTYVSVGEKAGLSYEQRCALAENCLGNLVAVAGPFAEFEYPVTHSAFVVIAYDLYGIDATNSALAVIRRHRVVH